MANFQGMLDRMCKSYAGDSGKMLLHMGALGWLLSTASQLFMVAKSKHIEQDKKRFLLWQEALDGVVNVGLYYTLTDFAKRGSDWIVENRRMPKSTIEAAKKFANIAENDNKGLVDFFKTSAQEFAQGSKKGLFPKLKESGASGFYKKAIDAAQGNEGLLKALEKSQGEFRSFKNGVGTAVSILASVLAVSIITPIVRNKLTNSIVKQRHEAPEDRNVFYNSARPMPLVFKNVGGDRLKV